MCRYPLNSITSKKLWSQKHKGLIPPILWFLDFFTRETKKRGWRCAQSKTSHLDSILDFTSVVSDDEGGLHDGGELDVAVSFMLTLELVQQGLIGSLGETTQTVFNV